MFSRVSLLRKTLPCLGGRTSIRGVSSFPPIRVFEYETIRENLNHASCIDAVEASFGKLAKDEVDVPIPMHIGIAETATAGPGDCHIKGGYVLGTKTWTVKLANVSFYNNIDKGLPPGSGIFMVCDATNGAPLGVFQENRFMTDLRTGAAGAICVKHCVAKHHKKVAFLGTGAIAMSMAKATSVVHGFDEGFAFGLDPVQSQGFANEVEKQCGYKVNVAESAEEAVRSADVIFTQTTGADTVLELDWLQPHATIIASGSDQPTKNEIPAEVQAASKMVCDLVRQCALVGELRSALEAGTMTKDDVYAEIGELCNGKPGREGDELILCDLTGTGAQDAAIGQVAWDVLSKLD